MIYISRGPHLRVPPEEVGRNGLRSTRRDVAVKELMTSALADKQGIALDIAAEAVKENRRGVSRAIYGVDRAATVTMDSVEASKSDQRKPLSWRLPACAS